jgi:hypothetical protein
VQIATARGGERRLLSVALELETAMPWLLTPRSSGHGIAMDP